MAIWTCGMDDEETGKFLYNTKDITLKLKKRVNIFVRESSSWSTMQFSRSITHESLKSGSCMETREGKTKDTAGFLASVTNESSFE